AFRGLPAPRRLPYGHGSGDAQHGRGAAAYLACHARSEVRRRHRRLRGRRRHLSRLLCHRRRRARGRACRRVHPRLPALARDAPRRSPRRAGTSALMAAFVYALTALLGAGAATAGIAGMLGTRWTLHVGWVVPLDGLALEMDALAGLFVALVGAA